MLFAMINSSFSSLYIQLAFKLNRKFIATTLCENKSRPWLHCNGKCYLMKKLREAKENEAKKQDREENAKLKLVYIQVPICTRLSVSSSTENQRLLFTGYNFRYRNPALESIFKPPKQDT